MPLPRPDPKLCDAEVGTADAKLASKAALDTSARLPVAVAAFEVLRTEIALLARRSGVRLGPTAALRNGAVDTALVDAAVSTVDPSPVANAMAFPGANTAVLAAARHAFPDARSDDTRPAVSLAIGTFAKANRRAVAVRPAAMELQIGARRLGPTFPRRRQTDPAVVPKGLGPSRKLLPTGVPVLVPPDAAAGPTRVGANAAPSLYDGAFSLRHFWTWKVQKETSTGSLDSFLCRRRSLELPIVLKAVGQERRLWRLAAGANSRRVQNASNLRGKLSRCRLFLFVGLFSPLILLLCFVSADRLAC